jgi:hypothetical protein
MNRAGWILLFIVFAVCAYATLQKEHMATASGHTLGPSTIVDNSAYADTVADELGQIIRRNMPTSTDPSRDVAVPPVCPTGSTFSKAKGACVDGQNKTSPAPCPEGYGFIRRTGNCELVAPEPAPRNARMSGSGNMAPTENVMITGRPAVCASGTFVPGKGCVSGDDATAAGVPPICPNGGTYVPDPEGLTEGMCETRTPLTSESSATMSGFPQEPPQCPPRRPFVPGKGCVGSNGKISQPVCFDGAPYIPDPRGMEIGTCGPVPEPKRATQDRAPPSERPPGAYTDEGTPAQVAPAALTGLQVGGPNDGGIGRSSGGSSNATWGGNGTKYPNLLGPDNKKSNLPDNNMTANLVLPTPCQVGVDGSTLYSPGCRAPTDLGYFTLPTIPKTDGDPSPFSGDYTVFMK